MLFVLGAMTEADYQLTVTTVGTVLVAALGTVTAVFGYRNHQQGLANADAIAQVQKATSGANTTLASNLASSQAANEQVIRTIASSTVTPPAPPGAP